MKNKISTLQIVSLIWQIMTAANIGIITYITIFKVEQDGWISIIISSILGLIPLCLYLYLMKYNPDMNFIELNEDLFGKVVGKIINTVLAALIIFCVMLYFNNLSNFITSQYLHKTPNLFGITIFMIPVIYLVTQNITVIGRVSFILFIFGVILLLLTILGLMGQVDLTNFNPIMEHNWKDIFNAALLTIPYTSLPTILLLSIRKNDVVDSKKLNKRVYIAYGASFFVIFLALFFVISVLGPELALLYQYPEFHVLKRISVGGFIERIESTLSLRWIFFIFMTLVFGLYFVKQYIKTTFNIKKNKSLNIIISLVTIVTLISSNWLFSSNTQSNMMTLKVIPIIIAVINLGITLLAVIRTKTKRN